MLEDAEMEKELINKLTRGEISIDEANFLLSKISERNIEREKLK